MMIGSYPYLLNPSGMGGIYAAAVANQAVQPIAPIQTPSSSFITFGGALSSQTASEASSSPTASTVYTPGSTLNITA
jgi:hypothetical protein